MLSAIPFFPPVKFDLGFIEIHGFGIMVALGLWLGTEMAMRKAKRDGLDPDIINRVVTWMIVGIFVGGHLGHAFFYAPEEIEKQGWIYLLKVWDGLSSFGGFIVTSFLCWLFFRKENNRVRRENSVRVKEGKKLLHECIQEPGGHVRWKVHLMRYAICSYVRWAPRIFTSQEHDRLLHVGLVYSKIAFDRYSVGLVVRLDDRYGEENSFLRLSPGTKCVN